MESKPQQNSFFDILKDIEDFLHDLNPKNCSPPFITSVFSLKRHESFQSVRKICLTRNENMSLFISKFESEYVEILRSKLREHYIDVILQKKYEVPEEINIKEIESYGAVSELAQLAVSIAEWALELEICAYTLEGLELYGLVKSDTDKQEGYLKILKKEYNFKEKSMLAATTEYALRRCLNFAFGKAGSMVIAQGMSRGGFQADGLFNLLLKIPTLTEIPWKSIAGGLDFTWIIGGFVFSYLLQMLNDYSIKKQVFAQMTHVKETFESNTLHLMTQRKIIFSLMEKVANEQDKTKCKSDMRVLLEAVNETLNPPEHLAGKCKDISKSSDNNDEEFRVKEEDDVVVVEDGNFKEKVDKSGVVVIEW